MNITHNPSLAYVLQTAINSVLSTVHTAFPGQVDSYDYTTCKASIKPSLSRTYDDGTVIEPPVIPNVPVLWPRTSLGSISFPLQRGDGCLVICSERSLDEWLLKGTQQAPSDNRMFDLSDAIAIPGLYSFANASPITTSDRMEVNYNGQQISIDKEGGVYIGKDHLKKLVTEAFSTLFNNHVHNYIGFVGGASTACVTSSPATSIGTTPVRVNTMPDNPAQAHTWADDITNEHLTSKVKATND